MRRYIALTITAVLALALAPFGVAEASHEVGHLEVTITAPANGTTLAGTQAVKVQISESEGPAYSIKQYWVAFGPAGGGKPYGYFCSETYDEGVDGSVTLQFTWDTNRYPTADAQAAANNCDNGNPSLPAGGTAAPLPNGEFEIRASAVLTSPVGFESVSEDAAPVKVGVSNAPSTPTGVKLKYSESTGKITVSWNENPETHDAIDYRVQECTVDRSSKPCEKWKTVDDVSGTSLTVTRTKPAIYRYRVIALRPAANGSTMTSGAATPQSDPTEIQVEDDDESTPTSAGSAGEEGEEEQPPPEPVVRTVERPTRRVQRAAPQVLQRIVEEDPGYSEELPYGEGDGEEAIGGLPGSGSDGDGDAQRAVLIPLAGGTLLLVFALQVHHVNRRASRKLEPVPAEALDGDWNA